MEVTNMKNIIRSSSLLATFLTAILLTGCGTGGIFGSDNTGGSTGGTYDPYERNLDNVRGTVERVDTRAQTIVVDPESTDYRNNLRNGDDEIVLAYDNRTTVEYQGRTYRPEDLEPGDRILAEIASTSQSYDRPLVNEIQVLSDVSGGGLGNDDDYIADRNLRGTVRYIDTRDRTVELETTSRGFTTGSTGVVVVHYDTQTLVEYQGRRYSPENLERGDEVEVEVRDSGGRLLAEEIRVVNDVRSR